MTLVHELFDTPSYILKPLKLSRWDTVWLPFLRKLRNELNFSRHFIRGIKHDIPFINIRKVPREVLKIEGVARGFQPCRGTLRMLMNDKIMFDRYYCINLARQGENEENIGALYFITSSHFPTRVRF